VTRYLGLLVLVVGAITSVAMLQRSASARTLEAQREADFTRIQKTYLERVGWMRTNPDDASYRQELAPFFKKYFEEISAHQERYALGNGFDAYLKELEERGAERADDRKAFYDYTRKIFDALRGGRYRPVWTATEKGMRLDVVSADLVTVVGKPQVRMQLLLWGAQREMREDMNKLKRMVTSASFETTWKLFDAKGKLVGEMSGGDPSMKVDYPERFIAEFPPQMVFGHYDVDPVPAEVKKMEITFKVGSRTASGGTATATYAWKLDVPDEWRLRAGQTWEGATVSERPEEEINSAASGR
jgi:hypothetical protein